MTIAIKSSVSTGHGEPGSACRSNDRDCRWRAGLRSFASFITDEDGTTAVEYAVVVALIAAAVVASVGLMTKAAEDSFTSTAGAIRDV